MNNYTKADILKIAKEKEVRFVRLQFTDILGSIKNVAISVSQLEKALERAYGNNFKLDLDLNVDEIIETIPQRRFVKPVEIAKLVKYLVSDDAKGITGQSINLCAGLSVGI